MNFPVRPTCHGDVSQGGVFKVGDLAWRPERAGESFRTCSYCGSVHPEDLLRLLGEGARLGGSDWKYGWPHKFYLTRHKRDGEERGLWAKWYNEHLEDVGLDEEAFKTLVAKLAEHSSIEFSWGEKDGRRVLRYIAPHPGYQR